MNYPSPVIFSMDDLSDNVLKYAVICARYHDKWVFCRHRSRETWELPGGHIEAGETALEAAYRELYEETGANEVKMTPLAVYKLFDYGLLCFAEIKTLSQIPEKSEIGEIQFSQTVPMQLTYPDVHDCLFRYVQRWLLEQNKRNE